MIQRKEIWKLLGSFWTKICKSVMEKLSIRNKNGQNLVVLLEKIDNSKGLVFIAHGLGGFKEQRHKQIFPEAFREKGFTVVRWDAANTIGESGGKMEDATVTSYYEDLE